MKKQTVRPFIEPWLAQATPEQRIAVDEFIGVLTKDGDSGSVHDVVAVLLKMVAADYLRGVIDMQTDKDALILSAVAEVLDRTANVVDDCEQADATGVLEEALRSEAYRLRRLARQANAGT